jgi:hypothetical protein
VGILYVPEADTPWKKVDKKKRVAVATHETKHWALHLTPVGQLRKM